MNDASFINKIVIKSDKSDSTRIYFKSPTNAAAVQVKSPEPKKEQKF